MINHNNMSLHDLQAEDSKPFKSGGQIRYLCPFCGHSKSRDNGHRSLAVNPDTGAWICHRCSASGLLLDYRSRQKPRHRQKRSDYGVQSSSTASHKVVDTGLTERLKCQLRRVEPSLEGTPAEEYLAQRGIPSDLAYHSRARYAPYWGFGDNSPGCESVVFPLYNSGCQLVAVTGRAICGDQKLTYGAKSQGVFSSPNAFSGSLVAVTEAPIDALTLASCGLPSIALAGTSFPGWLPVKLGLKHVLIASDADQAGDTAADNLVAALGSFCRCFRLRPPSSDWNEVLQNHSMTTLKGEIDNQLRYMDISL